MKKTVLFLALASYFNCKSQISATSSVLCNGQTATLSVPSNQLNTTLAAGNSHNGAMFNLVAINTLTVNSFDTHINGNTTIEIYYKAGTYAGFENSSTSWTLVGAASVTAQPLGNLTAVPVPVNITIPAGQTYAFYVTSSTGGTLRYTNGTLAGAIYSSDANLQFSEGVGVAYPFGTLYNPRVWNGKINYTTAIPTTYTWSTGANTPTIAVSPSVTTTYTVAVSSSTNVSSLSLSVNPLPTVSVNSGSICSGNSFSIIPSGANTYTIQGGSTHVSPLITSNYTVSGTSSEGCVSANTATSNVVVHTTPTVSVNNGTICTGNSFSIIPSGANTYTIQGGSTNVSPTSTSDYTVNGTSAQGCVSANTATSNVLVNTTPTVSVNNGTICSGNSFSIIPSGASTYTIQGGSTNVSPLASSSYTVKGTATNGCVSANTATSNLTVNTTPTVSVNNGTICSGNSFSIIPSGANTYTIQGGSTNVSPLTNSTYTVSGTAANGCVSANTATSNLTVNTTPTVSVNNGTICSGNSFSIIPAGASTYTIQGGSTNVSPLTNSTYTVNGTAANGCVSANTATSNLTVNTTPTVSVNNGTICSGNSFSIIPTGANTYTIQGGSTNVSPLTNSTYTVNGTAVNGCVSANTATSNLTVNTTPTVSVNSGTICSGNSFSIIPAGADTYTIEGGSTNVSPLTNSSYTVIGTTTNGCVSANTATSSLIVNTTPTVSVNSGTICSGNSFSIIPTGADTYTIEGGSSNVSPLTNSSYTVVGTATNGCPSANTATSNLVVNTTPTITVNDGLICVGQSFTITPNGTDTYTFSGGSNIVSPVITSTYSVSGTSSLGCVASNTAICTITVVTTPTITVNSGVICAGQIFSIVPGGATSYTFSNGSSTVAPTSNSTYSITGSVGPGCLGTNTAICSVTVNPLPAITANSNATLICNTESATLTAAGAITYSWNTNATTPVITISPTVTTSYTVDGTDTNGCTNSTTYTQNVNECVGIAKSGKTGVLLTIFPNPSNGVFILDSETKTTVFIYDAIGKLIFNQNIAEGKQKIDLSVFKNGLYILKAENTNHVKTFRLIKE